MKVQDYFNKAAESYDLNCQLQTHTGEKLLKLCPAKETIIDLGCGSGIITQKLSYKKLYALDIAGQLLQKAKTRLNNQNVIFLEESFDSFSGLELDLAFANMSLQWSNDLSLTFNNIKSNLKPGGLLAFSLPLAGTFANLTSRLAFHSEQEIKALLKDWQIIHHSSEEISYNFPSLIDALRSIKAVGANYCPNKKMELISRDKKPSSLKYNIGYFMAKLDWCM